MIKINLLPVRAAAKVEVLRKHLSTAVLLLILFAIALSYAHYLKTSRLEELNTQIAETQKEIDALKKVIDEVNKFKKDKETLSQQLSVIAKLNDSRVAPVYMLDEISKVVPENLWLVNVKETNWALDLQGVGDNNETVGEFIANMERSPMFTDIRLKQTKSEGGTKKGEGKTTYKFSISAKFVPPKAKEGK